MTSECPECGYGGYMTINRRFPPNDQPYEVRVCDDCRTEWEVEYVGPVLRSINEYK